MHLNLMRKSNETEYKCLSKVTRNCRTPCVLHCFFSPRQAQGYCVALRTLEGKHGPGRAQQSSQLNIQVDGKQGVEHTASEGRTPCSCCRGTGANSLQGG